jgi:probable phosphoglycerate mutase
MTMAEYAAAHPEEYRAFRAGRYDVVPAGETTPRVVTRVVAAAREALAALAPGECGVLVSHGGALKVSILALLGWPDGAAGTLQGLDNCGWAELHDSGDRGRLRLAAYNRVVPGAPDFATDEGVG